MLFIPLLLLIHFKGNSQIYVNPDLVVPVTIEKHNSNPEIPSGFRLANVDFLTNSPDYASSAMILDDKGDIVWRHTNPLNLSGNAGSIFNFNRINDTTMIWYTFANGPGYYLILNNDYTVRDTVRAIGNVTRLRPHDLLILPNGNYLTMANVFERISPSLNGIVIKPGITLDSSSSTIENIWIQEISPNGNLIKEWRSLDHIDPVTTWDTSKISSNTAIRILHTNSLDYYFDQNEIKILTSNLESNELIIIDWNSGNIDQRIEGRNSTMLFEPGLYTNDILDLYGQHYAKILDWNQADRKLTITTFNNRFNVNKAEGLVLQLDFNAGTVRKNAAFLSSPPIKSTHLGNIDLYNNNWLVNWGRTYEGRENATGFNQFGIKQFNLFLPDSVDAYRIFPVSESEMDSLKNKRPTITQNGCNLIASSSGYWQDGTSFGDTFTVTQADTFFIETSYGIGWTRSEKLIIESTDNECGTVGIANNTSEQDLLVFPNPSNGFVYIDNLKPGSSLKLIDILGNVLIHRINTGTKQEINLSEFASGIYIIKSGTSSSKIIKN